MPINMIIVRLQSHSFYRKHYKYYIINCYIEKLEEQIKEVDVRRQEHISSLTLQLKKESDQKAIVEQLQQKITEGDARHKQMDCNLDKEKENNRRLYKQYLKALNELQSLHNHHKAYIRNKIEYQKHVNEQLKTLTAEKVYSVAIATYR